VEPREQRLTRTFVELADTLVDDFDVHEFLHLLARRSVELLDVDEAGLMLADNTGRLRLAAASAEQARLLELIELQTDQGPCLDCYASGEPVVVEMLTGPGRERWPRFADEATAAGFHSVLALPLRLRQQTIGALNLFRAEGGAFNDEVQQVGRALADVATIGILQERGLRGQEILARQLQAALNSRVAIEQAKGVLAERHQIDVERAFHLLRSTARSKNTSLSEMAKGVVQGETEIAGRQDTPQP
jgi:transcriptional regulator with GAF, ATPase, and Fis domain